MTRRAVLLLALLVPGVLQADTFPTQERGFQAEKAFHVGDFDTVNLFNGNLILTIPIGGSYPVGGGLSYGLTLVYNSNVWDYQVNAGYTHALPNRRSNAGMGWRLSLGDLLDGNDPENDLGGLHYVGADGAEHFFYDTLHEGEAVSSTVLYTRDGSYLRLRSPAVNQWAVEFPDGLVQTFTKSGVKWRLTRMADRFGNFANVTYTQDQAGNLTAWKVQDQHGRTQTVNLVAVSFPYDRFVSSVVLSAFNGATATYTFGYSSVTLPRANPHDDSSMPNVTVPLLTSVTLPDGLTSWSMPTSDYHLDKSVDGRLPGVLKAVTTPLLGRVEWTYGGYGFPTKDGERPWRNFSMGVYRRALKNHSGVTVGTWTYTPSLNPIPGPNQPGREAVRTLITPLGDKTESFFSVAQDAAYSGWSEFDYGLPFTRNMTDGGTPARYLSTRAYDCDGAGANCVLKRSTYVAYERDEGLFAADSLQNNMNRNRRVSATRTTYHDDASRWEAASFSRFDGLGHYRQTDLSGNFDAGNSATLVTNYNPARGNYPGSFAMLSGGDPWVLGMYNEQTRTEGTATARTEHCFDANGFLLRTRTLKAGVDRQTDDVVASFTHSAGNLTKEEYYGGDVQALLKGDLCGLDLPASQYRIDHTWQYGTRKTSQHSGAAFKSLDADIDLNTGLVKASRDGGGIQTSYEYDFFGRLAWIKPATGHDGWTQYVYSRSLGASSPAQVQMLRQPNGGGTALAESIVKYDSFGRVWQEHTKMPDGAWSIRQTQYNPLHWKVSVSEQGSTAKKTEFLDYDPFGRPGKIRPPDGVSHEVNLYYLGVRQVSRNSKVGNALVGGTIDEVIASTQEIYDRQGRLYQVREQAEADATNTDTFYTYDVGNRLSRVRQVTTKGTQNRWFTYDNRGFLTSEQHPEKGGATGNGTVTYSNYDARGHAGRKVDGTNNLTFTYDGIERLTNVSETGGQPLKTFAYGTDGRLSSASRYNYVPAPFNATVQVTESYTYGGRQGRISRRNTQMTYNGVAKESFAQTWTWNALGDSSTIGYPECTFAPCTAVARSVNPAYTNGFLTSVPGWANSINYHSNGMVNQVTHSNAVVDTQGNDPNGMQRPSSLSSARNGVTLWSSGSYAYDTSGNVVKTGNGYFLYDRVNRLIEGRIYDGPTGAGAQKWQSYTYDPFGNILAIGGTSGRSTLTDPATNRLNGAVTYDAAGNLTSWNGNTYEYDRFNQMTRMLSGFEDWRYMYGPSDERFWSFRVGGGGSLWALRDLDGRVLREYEAQTSWSTFNDYVYRGTQLLASSHSSNGVRHFHLDHLGTPRLITDANGTQKAYHAYYPFGEEATAFNQDTEQMKFTGHERDLASLAGAGDDLDYMHARSYSPLTGRFLGTDRFDLVSLQFGDEVDRSQFRDYLSQPQGWNRFAYTKGNPLKYIDADGESAALALSVPLFSGSSSLASIAAAANPVGAVILVGSGSFLLGTGINKIPGVSETIQDGFGAILDTIYLAQNTKHNVIVASSNLARAIEHVGLLNTGGGPGKDPDFNHHKTEIKAFLKNAKKAAGRLPGKLRDAFLKKIEEIARQGGVSV